MEARLTDISREEALRYLGVRGKPDAALRRDLDRCAALLEAGVRPRVCWRLFRRDEDGNPAGTALSLQGQDIRRFLSGCGQVILLAATLGAESESLIRRTQNRSMADAVILDALASAAIENVCDNLCADLAREFAPLPLTGRFSPGYGDFPLSLQRDFCEVLNVSRLLGITLTPGGLMIPQKSVTALVGLRADLPAGEGGEASGKGGPARAPARTTCASCALSHSCAYKFEEGSSCGKQ